MKALMDEYGKAIVYTIVASVMLGFGFLIFGFMSDFAQHFLNSMIGG